MARSVGAPRGMRDLLPRDKPRRDAVLNRLTHAFSTQGYAGIETPALENIERLKSKQGGENESMLFEILRRGLPRNEAVYPQDAVDLGLRYDLTLPLTRYFATNSTNLPAVFRCYQIGPVWRAERPQKGRFRQFTQCDIDIIGEAGWSAEVDVISTGWKALSDLGLTTTATVLLNDRRILGDLLTSCGFAQDRQPEVLITLDKLHKIGAQGVIDELERRGVSPDNQAELLVTTVDSLTGAPLSSESLDPGNGMPPLSVYDLPQIQQALEQVDPGISLRFDPSLVRGMGYYTGPIFEVVIEGISYSVCGGGRYDGVIGRWSGKDVPAVGLSFGFERIIDEVELQDEANRRSVALAYTSDAEAVKCMQVRAALLDSVASVGLVRSPAQPTAAFFRGVAAAGFTDVVLPNDMSGSAPDVLARARSVR